MVMLHSRVSPELKLN
ncbi:hypothetical protein F383_14578 [Gossypium arboreum]|uniref:Uncharacterized protein n=1 Tax=Gossypium arboreum TaxID=29729 RepID=A0A0B0NDK5_GOSAR|nr:hypothetical protein F383_14578 [Gossypium arboreum]